VVAFGVFVFKFARQDPGDDLHVLVGVGLEATTGADSVVVVDEKEAVTSVCGVVV
jgi:hypothetical protein